MYESCEIADLSHKYVLVHISHRYSIEKGMTHFKRSISHIAKIPSLIKKRKCHWKIFWEFNCFVSHLFEEFGGHLFYVLLNVSRTPIMYLVPSKYTSTALKDVKTDDHPIKTFPKRFCTQYFNNVWLTTFLFKNI